MKIGLKSFLFIRYLPLRISPRGRRTLSSTFGKLNLFSRFRRSALRPTGFETHTHPLRSSLKNWLESSLQHWRWVFGSFFSLCSLLKLLFICLTSSAVYFLLFASRQDCRLFVLFQIFCLLAYFTCCCLFDGVVGRAPCPSPSFASPTWDLSCHVGSGAVVTATESWATKRRTPCLNSQRGGANIAPAVWCQGNKKLSFTRRLANCEGAILSPQAHRPQPKVSRGHLKARSRTPTSTPFLAKGKFWNRAQNG